MALKRRYLSIKQMGTLINNANPDCRPALQKAVEEGKILIIDTASTTGRALKYYCEMYEVPYLPEAEVYEVEL